MMISVSSSSSSSSLSPSLRIPLAAAWGWDAFPASPVVIELITVTLLSSSTLDLTLGGAFLALMGLWSGLGGMGGSMVLLDSSRAEAFSSGFSSCCATSGRGMDLLFFSSCLGGAGSASAAAGSTSSSAPSCDTRGSMFSLESSCGPDDDDAALPRACRNSFVSSGSRPATTLRGLTGTRVPVASAT